MSKWEVYKSATGWWVARRDYGSACCFNSWRRAFDYAFTRASEVLGQ